MNTINPWSELLLVCGVHFNPVPAMSRGHWPRTFYSGVAIFPAIVLSYFMCYSQLCNNSLFPSAGVLNQPSQTETTKLSLSASLVFADFLLGNG